MINKRMQIDYCINNIINVHLLTDVLNSEMYLSVLGLESYYSNICAH
jgi:hypothetical protein